jgi:hypothetical protein
MLWRFEQFSQPQVGLYTRKCRRVTYGRQRKKPRHYCRAERYICQERSREDEESDWESGLTYNLKQRAAPTTGEIRFPGFDC